MRLMFLPARQEAAMTALNAFSDVLRHAVEEGAKTEYTELMLQAAELLDAKVYTRPPRRSRGWRRSPSG